MTIRNSLLVTTLSFAVTLAAVSTTNAQVGVNTPAPASTLDIIAKNATGNSSNVDGLLLPRVDRQRAQSMTGTPTSTMIYVNSIATGTQTGTAANIDAIGYYYYNGTEWTKLIISGSNNIYSTDGTLAGNRTVTQGTNTLAFNSTATTGTNHFSVDGATLNVDAVNNRIGIGTNAPPTKLNVVDNSNTNQYHGIANFLANNLSAGVGIGWNGIQSVGTNPNNDLTLNAKGTGNMILQTQGTGNVGIATTTPQKSLHVNGTMQLTNELNVGGNAGAAGSAGTAGQVLTSAGPGAAPTWGTPGGTPEVIKVAFPVYPSGATSGTGGSNTGGITALPLTAPAGNNSTFNSITGASISSNSITLPAGTYRISTSLSVRISNPGTNFKYLSLTVSTSPTSVGDVHGLYVQPTTMAGIPGYINGSSILRITAATTIYFTVFVTGLGSDTWAVSTASPQSYATVERIH